MGRPLITPAEDIDYAKKLIGRATNMEELRLAQSVLLPESTGKSLEEVAMLMGVGRRTLTRHRNTLRAMRQGRHDPKRRGGRHHQKMSVEEEKILLASWHEQAAKGQMIVVGALRQALSRQLGAPVGEVYVYRLLARNGWRKLAPDTRHPKAGAQAQQDWKKTLGNAGKPRVGRAGQRQEDKVDVSGPGAIWPHGAHPQMLVAGPASPRGAKRLPARTHLCIRGGKPEGRPA